MRDIVPRVNVVHHDRKRSEIKGHIVAQSTSVTNPDPPVIPLPNQIDVANVAVIWIGNLAIAGVQTVIENPREIVPVNDPENQGFVGIECHRHGVENSRISRSPIEVERWGSCLGARKRLIYDPITVTGMSPYHF